MLLALLLALADPAPPAPSTPPPAASAPQPPAASTPPPPAQELQQLKVLDGKWTCTGKTLDTPYGSAHAISATMENKTDLNGYWRIWRYVEKKTKENASPYMMVSFVGFDPLKKQLTRTDVDGIGMMTTLNSTGWVSEQLVWEGVVGPAKVPFRETLTKKSEKEIRSAQEIVGGDGKWLPLSETTCKKKP